MTLLDKAKSFSCISRGETVKHCVTKETIELSIAYLKDEISYKQYLYATNSNPGNTIYSLTVRSLREAYKQGLIKL